MPEQSARRGAKRSHAVAVGVSIAAHLGVLMVALLAVQPIVSKPRDTLEALPVALVPLRQIIAPPAPQEAAAPPTPASEPKAGKKVPDPAPTPRHVVTHPLESAEAGGPPPGLTDAELAGAASAGSGAGGGGGGSCDMVRRVQAALRKDPLVQAAAAEAHLAEKAGGRPVLVWNGDWVRSSSQDGKGLAAVREAIMWEVGFAPAACKNEPVHGYVLLSLNEAAGGVRLAVGAGEWRWANLLGLGR